MASPDLVVVPVSPVRLLTRGSSEEDGQQPVSVVSTLSSHLGRGSLRAELIGTSSLTLATAPVVFEQCGGR